MSRHNNPKEPPVSYDIETDGIITGYALRARIAELQDGQSKVDFDRDESFPDEDLQELTDLVQFIDDVENVTGNHVDSATIVAVEHFIGFVADELEEHFPGIGDRISSSMDWPKYARQVATDYRVVELAGDRYYVR
jgi:hypothetical protein